MARKAQPDPALEAYAALYDALWEKLRDMAGPISGKVETLL